MYQPAMDERVESRCKAMVRRNLKHGCRRPHQSDERKPNPCRPQWDDDRPPDDDCRRRQQFDDHRRRHDERRQTLVRSLIVCVAIHPHGAHQRIMHHLDEPDDARHEGGRSRVYDEQKLRS